MRAVRITHEMLEAGAAAIREGLAAGLSHSGIAHDVFREMERTIARGRPIVMPPATRNAILDKLANGASDYVIRRDFKVGGSTAQRMRREHLERTQECTS